MNVKTETKHITASESAAAPVLRSSALSATSIEAFLLSQLPEVESASMHDGLAYHEMSDTPVQSMDLVSELEMNVARLSQLRSRLVFMNREIRYLLRVY